jgi:hypothetical protein
LAIEEEVYYHWQEACNGYVLIVLGENENVAMVENSPADDTGDESGDLDEHPF